MADGWRNRLMKTAIRFLGGAGTVTGSKHLLELGEKKILVDCGLFQGLKELRLENWAPFPVNPAEIDYVILTHAHLDHSGYLPILAKNGFKGKVLCTAPTLSLSKIILLDSAKIQEEDAERANIGGYSKHTPARPLYTTEDAHLALRLFKIAPVDSWQTLFEGVRYRLTNSGHILGSVLVEIQTADMTIALTGDLGRMQPLLLHPPRMITDADYLVVESTYGDRVHPATPPLQTLEKIIAETLDQGGHVLIPAFAVGRTQDILYLLSLLKKKGKLRNIPVYLDSPMAANTTQIFTDYPEWHKLSPSEVDCLCETVSIVESQKESEKLQRSTDSSIVIAGSGMITGGRILSHLEERLSDPKNTVVLVGYQPPSTRGSLLRDGINELKIRGRYVPVKARIEDISTLSAHADQSEILNWMRGFQKAPKHTFIVHGEPQAANALRVRITDTFHWKCSVAKLGESVTLS